MQFLRIYLGLFLFAVSFSGAMLYPASAHAENSVLPQKISIEQMAGQMIMVGFRGTGYANMGNLDTLKTSIAKGNIGGVILFDRDQQLKKYGRNIISAEQVKDLTAMLNAANTAIAENHKLFIAVDQEGGKVRRLKPLYGFSELPSASEMGKLGTSVCFAYGEMQGSEMQNAGINLDFAPVVDVDINSKSPAIGALGRSFGNSGSVVAEKAGAFARGLNKSGVLASYKHFPGHGSAGVDTHDELADISKSWNREAELAPYITLLAEPDYKGMVMVGHLWHKEYDKEFPASLSSAVINGFLRDGLGWQGVVITDDLQMKAISSHYSLEETILLAVNAGVDIILLGNNIEFDPGLADKAHTILMGLVRDGKIKPERIEESYSRIIKLKNSL